MRNEGRAVPSAARNGAAVLAQLVADEDADVDGKDARTALGNGDEVEKFLTRHPFVLVDHLGLDNGNHGISTTKGEHANLEEGC